MKLSDFIETEVLVYISLLAAVIPALFSLLSVHNYTTFDRKLVPRNKSTIIYIKQIISSFLMMVPLMTFAAYYLAFVGIKFIGVNLLISIIMFIWTIFLLSICIGFWKWFTTRFQRLQRFQIPVVFKLHGKIKMQIIVLFTLSVVTLIAVGHIQTNIDNLVSYEFLVQLLIISILTGFLCLILLTPIISSKKPTEYHLLTKYTTEQDINQLFNGDKLILDYYLNDQKTVFNSLDSKYRIIRYVNGEYSVRYEVYEVINNVDQ